MILSLQGLIAILWLAFALSTLLSIGRIVIRIHYFRRFYADDYFHAAAVVFSLIFSTLSAVYRPTYYTATYDPEDPTQLARNERLHPLAISVGISFWLTIYAVKFGFLALYLRLFGVSRRFRIVWAVVTAFAVISFWITFALTIWFCKPPVHPFDIEGCDLEFAELVSGYPSLWVPAALHLVSDATVIALPLWQIHKLPLQPAEKVGSALLFLVAAIGTFMDVLRAALTDKNPTQGSGVGGFAVCDVLEPLLAVILSALIAYAPLIRRPETRGTLSSSQHARAASRNSELHLECGKKQKPTEPDPRTLIPSPPPPPPSPSPLPLPSPSLRRFQRRQTMQEDIDFIGNVSPIERKFYRLWQTFLEKQEKRHSRGSRSHTRKENGSRSEV